MFSVVKFPTTLYCFGEDNHSTLLDAIQSPDVFAYLKNPRGFPPPPELTYLLVRLQKEKPHRVALELVRVKKMCYPATDMEHQLIASLKEARPKLLERAKVIDWLLKHDVGKMRLPVIVYPFLYGYSPKEMALQLFQVYDQLYSDTVRVFFAFAFKFAVISASAFWFDKSQNLSEWKKGKQRPKDEHYAVYIQAANALWDYIAHLEQRCVLTACRSDAKNGLGTKQLGESWLDWCKGKTYSQFLARMAEPDRQDQHRLQVFIKFLWIYFDESVDIHQVYLGEVAPEKKRLKITPLRESDRNEEHSHEESSQ